MILSVNIANKAFGDKLLYNNLHFDIKDGEKVALIGRNGTGKTTLLHIITGEDTDYDGEVKARKGIIIIGSRQEHHKYDDLSVIDYILGDLPEYKKLHHIITHYPADMADSNHKMQVYADALERFSQLGYFEAESDITEALKNYQLSEQLINNTLGSLSGGQKRLVELVKIQRATAHIALIDEPTNHMDYVAKNSFIKWMNSAKEAVLLISHDRDVLREVDKIIEIKDNKAFIFKGNYDDYLRINATKTVSAVHEFNVTKRRIANLQENVIRFQRLKEKSRDPGTIQRFKSLEQRARQELAELEQIEAPSFWIDRESVHNLNSKVSSSYDQHKTRNIRVSTNKKVQANDRLLIDVKNLSLGFSDKILFDNVSFNLRQGQKLRLHGRNGVGKSTLVKAIIAKASQSALQSTVYSGSIKVEPNTIIGVYEQEINPKYLNMSLATAIEEAYMAKDVVINDTKTKQLLGDYLFNPATDGDILINRLSGGQKARFQLINMLIGDPQVLILDEPTNHLDLPSIEELEDALKQYNGAIIYISHDSYFAKNINTYQEVLLKTK
jgi:ATPase subunit of ABC transporter with duplicated ATPase domains